MGPLDDEATAHLQAIVDDMYGLMLNDIGKGSRHQRESRRSELRQGPRVLCPRRAGCGLVDRIATMDELLAELTTANAPRSRSARIRNL
jgi:ClpP class serine protease